jgi:hypothetical protein
MKRVDGKPKKLRKDRVDMTGQRFFRLTVIAPARCPSNFKGGTFWECQCDCGNKIVTRRDSLKRGRTKSCGCWLNSSRLPDDEASWNQVINNFKYSARLSGYRKRTIEWKLTDEQTLNIIKKNCHYCNLTPSESRRLSGRGKNANFVFFNGIDRVDSTKGYEFENCVPCCKYCNFAKNDMSYDDFKKWICRVYSFFVTGNPGCSILPSMKSCSGISW